jgi:protein TonB
MAKRYLQVSFFLLFACSSAMPPAEPEFVQTDIGPAVRLGARSPVKMPKIVRRVDPVYPQALREEGIQGIVRLETLIDSSGRIGGIKLISISHPEFVKSAIGAVSQWHYEKPLLDGRPVAVIAEITVAFRLN